MKRMANLFNNQKDIDKAINNAQKALYMAQAGQHDYVVYDDFSDIG